MGHEAFRLQANPPKLYAFKFISEFFLIVPVLIPYYVFNRLSATQIFTIQAAFHVAVLILEVPSGYLADVMGRKKTLVVTAVFFPLGLALYAFTGSFITFVLAELCVAVANSMRSGSDSALMYDSLVLLNKENEYKKYEGRSFFFTRIGTAAASIIGGLLALRSLHLPFYVNVATYSL
ncbi:MAG: MFS transporter, partial [Candidatus Aminicenantes bacterium]|nr:MFS transporter [Candidatus Aminicenantes bacterium]